MIFDFNTLQHAIIVKLQPLTTLWIADHFEQIDLTDDATSPIAAKLSFVELLPSEQTANNVALKAHWMFIVQVDAGRANDVQKADAMDLFTAAMTAIANAEFAVGAQALIEPGLKPQPFDRILTLSFGFSIPVYLAGN